MTPTLPVTGIRYVAPSGSDASNTCTSSSTPCLTIQHAVDQAQPGEEVRVATGTYTGVSARAGITQTVYISKTVTIQGGYTTTNWTSPDPAANPTTLDAQGLGRVMVISGTIAPTVEGLRITGGDATGLSGGAYQWDAGGGVYVYGAGGVLRKCTVYSNTAGSGDVAGGGVYLFGSSVALEDNTIYYNTADHDGGGVYLQSSSSSVSRNTVVTNTAQYGAGLYVMSSDATLTGNTVRGNVAGQNGGGLFLSWGHPTLRGNLVTGNTASYHGGGLDLQSTDATLTGNTIVGNSTTRASSTGGGLRLATSDATFINNVVAGNHSDGTAAGIYIQGSSPRLLHTTIANNTGGDGSGVYVTESWSGYSTAVFTNTIISGHTVGITVTTGSTATLNATLWHGNDTDRGGAGTINHSNDHSGDPAFVNPAGGDYHIGAMSAAIDKGVDVGVTTDIDSDARPWGDGYDIGADEYGQRYIYLPLVLKEYD